MIMQRAEVLKNLQAKAAAEHCSNEEENGAENYDSDQISHWKPEIEIRLV